ncbi:mitochondrial import inner membrane translocase subunit TIM16 [Coemansia sp. BCRC 34490]|nr:mitochondrial import inner membrane translocase subunit TIM16 [Coemansia sp. BCRC 34490]
MCITRTVDSAAAQAAAGNTKAVAEGDRMSQASGITVDESTKILNIEDPNNKDELSKKFEHLFNANDPKKGGSLYLQAKVIRARERIEMHWAQEKLKAEQEELMAKQEEQHTESEAFEDKKADSSGKESDKQK